LNAAFPAPPDAKVRLDLYYSRGDRLVHWHVYQNGTLRGSGSFRAWTAKSRGRGQFTEAFAGVDFSTSAYTSALPSFTRPMADAKLFAVSGVHYTTYNGTKGTVAGPWPYTQLELGTASTNVYANAPVLRNGGKNFGVWARS
jgi:hypothetical protein